MKSERIYVNDCGIVTCLGRGKMRVAQALVSGKSDAFALRDDLCLGRKVYVGAVTGELPGPPAALRDIDCRNNRLMQVALSEIVDSVEKAARRYGRDRIAVVMGTSTSGISDGEAAFAEWKNVRRWPETYDYQQQEIGSLSTFSARFFGLSGPAYTLATACSSSAKIFASARRLIRTGLVDAAVVGGADTLCRMTIGGFGSLELLSEKRCNPFSANRNGITIGEGAAAFLLSKDAGPVELLGIGETSDAHHLTAPDPEGKGAEQSMRKALADAKREPSEISYINLHGTATLLNDAMEARAVSAVFGSSTPCSSTKGMTGHMLGAAGACEAGVLWLLLHPSTKGDGSLPPHVWDGINDPHLAPLNFVAQGTRVAAKGALTMLSNSFGFGGSNACLILGSALS